MELSCYRRRCNASHSAHITESDNIPVVVDWAFLGCDILETVSLPRTISPYIGESAFGACFRLTSVTIPDTVLTIGDGAFGACTRLTFVKIPNSVVHIGRGAFRSCSTLQHIEIPNSVTEIEDEVFCCCYSLQSISIPCSVQKIGVSAFSCCSGLVAVAIPCSVTHIEEEAFWSCVSLKTVCLPPSLDTIGRSAFELCKSLLEVVIQSPAIEIGSQAFSGCPNMVSVTIPCVVNSGLPEFEDDSDAEGIFDGCYPGISLVVLTYSSDRFGDTPSRRQRDRHTDWLYEQMKCGSVDYHMSTLGVAVQYVNTSTPEQIDWLLCVLEERFCVDSHMEVAADTIFPYLFTTFTAEDPELYPRFF